MPAYPLRDRITESLDSNVRVDREAGVVRGVKLIGFESKNGRLYPPSVLKAAIHHYEGAKVNIDHPEGPEVKGRKYGERFGVIRNARFLEGKGVYADFHFNPKHAMAEQFAWDAENNPESVGFSHNATLKLGGLQNGKRVIEQIIGVRSMDLVADPATTTSLFESEYPMDDEAVTDTPTDPKAAMKGAFRQMIMAAVDDSSLDMKATMKKIQEIMKAQEKLMGGGSAPAATAPGEASDDGEESVRHQTSEVQLLKQQLEQYQAKERQATMLKSIDAALVAEGLDPKNTSHVSDVFAKQLLATESEDARKAMIADRASLVGARPQGNVSNPTYRPPTPATEQIDAKTFASRLLG